jgi:HSP20 family protein
MGFFFNVFCGFLIFKFITRNPERKKKFMSLVSKGFDHIYRFFGFSAPLDVLETDTEYRVVVDLPGMSKDDISVEIAAIDTPKGKIDQLIVKGKRNFDYQRYTVVFKERCLGTFKKSLCFSERVNTAKVVATLKDGILEIIAPKAKGSTENAITVPIQ